MALIGWIWAAPVASAKNPTHAIPSVSSADRWLTHLSRSFAHLDTWSQTETAHAMGILKHREGRESLQRCALSNDGAAGSCTLALAALQDVEAVHTFRQLLRQGQSPVTIGVAAKALAAFDDAFLTCGSVRSA